MLIHILGGAAEHSDQPQIFDLTRQEEFIGRLQDLVIRVNDDSISRLHARVYKQNGVWWIEDLRSKNGIFINGHPTDASRIVEGDIITIGDIHFVLSYRQPEQVWEIEEWVRERRAHAEEIRRDIELRQAAEKGNADDEVTPTALLPPEAAPYRPPSTGTRSTSAPVWVPPAGKQPAAPLPTYDPQLTITSQVRPVPNVVDKDPLPLIIGIILGLLLVALLLWRYVFAEEKKPSPPPAAPYGQEP